MSMTWPTSTTETTGTTGTTHRQTGCIVLGPDEILHATLHDFVSFLLMFCLPSVVPV
jgi:hypothetical protein